MKAPLLLLLLVGASNGFVRLPRAASKVDILSLNVQSRIVSRFATTHVTSEVENKGSSAEEVTFSAQLPAEAFISNFTMRVDDQLKVAEVKGKEEAAAAYEKARASGRTAGIVAQKPRETQIFETSVNIRPGGKILFNLTYQEVLQRRHGVYKHVVNILPSEGVRRVAIEVVISERGRFAQLHVPTFAPQIAVKTNKELLQLPANNDVSTKKSVRDDVETVSVTLNPEGQGGQLAVLYDVEREVDGGEIEVVDGYFVHFFAPQPQFLDSASAALVFVLDKSGSMMGQKFNQLQEAMNTILSQLREEDEFSVMYFDDTIHVWKPTLQPATDDNIDKALNYVRRFDADGGTNIHGGLLEAFKIFQKTRETPTKPEMVMFLTDGLPSAGELLEGGPIRRFFKQRNRNRKLRVHSLSFGDDADYTMLQKLSAENKGIARKIYEASDAALQLDGFYSEIAVPVFTDLNITYLRNDVDPTSLLRNRDDSVFFNGSEVMVVGKLRSPLINQIEGEVSGKASNDGSLVKMGFDSDCVNCCSAKQCPKTCGRIHCDTEAELLDLIEVVRPEVLPPNSLGSFIERMWAFLSIKKDLMHAILNPSEARKLQDRAKRTALRYNFVTEMTSLVIADELAEPESRADNWGEIANEDDMDYSSGPQPLGLAAFRIGGSSRRSKGSPPSSSRSSSANLPVGGGGGIAAGPAPPPAPINRVQSTKKDRTKPRKPTNRQAKKKRCELSLGFVFDLRGPSRMSRQYKSLIKNSLRKLRKHRGFFNLAALNTTAGVPVVTSLSDRKFRQVSNADFESTTTQSFDDLLKRFRAGTKNYLIVLGGPLALSPELKMEMRKLKKTVTVIYAVFASDAKLMLPNAKADAKTLGKIKLMGVNNKNLAKAIKC